MEIYNMFKQRAENYKNVYDSTSGFMRPRLSNGEFKEKFDPLRHTWARIYRRKCLEL